MAVEAILERHDLREEAVAALPALERASRAEAGPQGVRSVVERRLPLYPAQQFSPAEWNAWWSDYIEVCADIPMSALEAGMLDWVRDPQSKFMPKPGELRERAYKVQNKAALATYRARRVAEHRDPLTNLNPHRVEPPLMRKVLTPEQKEAFAQQMDDFRGRLKHGEPITAPMPNAAGKPDQGGLTEQMRKLIARRQEAAYGV